MKVLEDLKEMLDDELKKITKKGDISPTELENAYKAVDILKDIETIKAMREHGEEPEEMKASQRGGYSQGYSERYMQMLPPYMGRTSYAMPEGGNAYAGNSYEMGGYDDRQRGSYEVSQRGGRGYSEDGMSNAGRRGRDADSDGRYSEEGSYEASYRRGRDAMGRFTSRDGSYEQGYSRHTQKEKMMAKLETMLEEASSEKERRAIMQCMDKLDD